MGKVLAVVLTLFLAFNTAAVHAAPERPSRPDTPEAADAPDVPEAPDMPDSPDEPDEPDIPAELEPAGEEGAEGEEGIEEPAAESGQDQEGLETPESPQLPGEELSPTATPTPPTNTPITLDPAAQQEPTPQDVNTNQTNEDVTVETGGASTSGTITNTGNTNLTTPPALSNPSAPSTELANTGNGTNSTNTSDVDITENQIANQTNEADLTNQLDLSSETGGNQASRNTGGEVKVESGDANVSGTIVNSVNTNALGATVAEYNVEGQHEGDLVLSLSSPSSEISVENSQNGSASTNTSDVDIEINEVTFQSNTAEVDNELILTADSGGNEAIDNTGGDVDIETGDANVSANVLNFLNNNLIGQVVYNVVNVFGDLVGNIVMPDEFSSAASKNVSSLPQRNVLLQNTDNGSNSTNTGLVNLAENNVTNQTNLATITNGLTLDATTGGNDASDNTGGEVDLETGDVEIDLQVINLANANLIGEDWWIVIVNEAGKWVGRIVGGEGDSHMAGSSGTNFAVGDAGAGAGAINITNEGNGEGSTNTGEVNLTHNKVISQTNQTNLTNTLDLSANTGGNTASRNTGGETKVKTGDAKIMANLVNFVNNNISGGNIFLTVVNVFGSWVGDFVGEPRNDAEGTGTAEENAETLAQAPTDFNEITEEVESSDAEGERFLDTNDPEQQEFKNRSQPSAGPEPEPQNLGGPGEVAEPVGEELEGPEEPESQEASPVQLAAEPMSLPESESEQLLAHATTQTSQTNPTNQTSTKGPGNTTGLVKPAIAGSNSAIAATRDYSGLTFDDGRDKWFDLALLAGMGVFLVLGQLTLRRVVQAR